jgi:DNA replication protein DnaC
MLSGGDFMTSINSQLKRLLKELRLPAMRQYFEDQTRISIAETHTYERYLLELVNQEYDLRRNKRTGRYLRESKLPLEKKIDNFNMDRLPGKLKMHVKVLLEGNFLDRRENVLAFGNPGSGKTHLLCAIGQELINKGRRIYFTTCSFLVQRLLRAKKELKLASELKKISKYEGIIIDDIGYVHQSREEMEVLFTLLAERYERGSILLTSNLPFSKWEKIFRDPMTTAAAIDRLVHHSIILELNLPSYRMESAKKAKAKNIQTD